MKCALLLFSLLAVSTAQADRALRLGAEGDSDPCGNVQGSPGYSCGRASSTDDTILCCAKAQHCLQVFAPNYPDGNRSTKKFSKSQCVDDVSKIAQGDRESDTEVTAHTDADQSVQTFATPEME